MTTSMESSDFASEPAPKSLRVTCYGSSSSKTPEKYLKEARSLGYTLAKRGHVCVNGAGSFGCMAAMNDGAAQGNGHIVGVIHEMFVVDGSDWCQRDGGAHKVFRKEASREGPTRECLVAGGDDLQERKRLLVEGADALVVLPGGPGTWDELWEMACSRNIGLTDIPIVCVNADGYYENFRLMLQRASEDELVYTDPQDIIHFEPTAEKAVQWVEQQVSQRKKQATRSSKLKRRDSAITVTGRGWLYRSLSKSFSGLLSNPRSWKDGKIVENTCWNQQKVLHLVVTFAAGVAVGVSAHKVGRVGPTHVG